MKHTISGEYRFFKKEKKKYHSWYFFFLFLVAAYVQYRFCISPFLFNRDVPVAMHNTHEIKPGPSAEQEALLAQAHAQSFTRDKLIALADRASEYDVKLTECSIQNCSEQQYLTKATVLLKMEGEFEDIAQFLDSITNTILCTVDSLQLSAGQESYQASVALSCVTIKS